MSRTYLFLLFVLSLNLCCGYRILVFFPMPGKSHTILAEGFVKPLLAAGHELTYVTPILMKEQPRLRQIDVSSNFNLLPSAELFDLSKLMEMPSSSLADFSIIYQLMYTTSNGSITHPNVQKLIQDPSERFDLVIAEWMFSELYSGLASVFDCPYIWSSSIEPHTLVLSLMDDHLNPAYTNDFSSTIEPPLTFIQRVKELHNFFQTQFTLWKWSSQNEKTYIEAYSAAVEKRGRKLTPLDVAKYNASLMFGNSHVCIGQAISLPQNYIPIIGYHIEETVKPLPEDLQKIMDNSANGVIYFSMGSMLKSHQLPEKVKKELLEVFSGLKQTVIWKFEEDLPNKPKNVHILKWAPQQSILAHPKCFLFITHGGLLSTTEALHFGVPTIGIPMFADQFINVKRAVNRGFAKEVRLTHNVAVDLKVAIQEILGNPKYRQRIHELSTIFHDRPISPARNLVFWTEFVIRTKGAKHLRSPALINSRIEKMYLDLVALIVVGLLVVVVAVKKILSSSSSKKVKKS